jgi:hypothetical protein
MADTAEPKSVLRRLPLSSRFDTSKETAMARDLNEVYLILIPGQSHFYDKLFVEMRAIVH